jgi:hypothetical protein
VLAGQEVCDVPAFASASTTVIKKPVCHGYTSLNAWLFVGGASPQINLAKVSVSSEAPIDLRLSRNEGDYRAVRSSAQGVFAIRHCTFAVTTKPAIFRAQLRTSTSIRISISSKRESPQTTLFTYLDFTSQQTHNASRSTMRGKLCESFDLRPLGFGFVVAGCDLV